MFKDVDPRQPGTIAYVPPPNHPVEFKCFRAADGFSPGPGWEYVGGREEPGHLSYYKDTNSYVNGQQVPLIVPMWNPGAQWLIFQRRRDTVIEELQEKVAKGEQALSGMALVQKDFEKREKEWLSVVNIGVKDRKFLTEQLNAQKEVVVEERARAQRMEADIQKLRTALGELRMSEILG